MDLSATYRRTRLLLVLAVFCFSFLSSVRSAPVQSSSNQKNPRDRGCFYLKKHYANGDRIDTKEPCLNCTCVNSMLMCYLRICPFVKPIEEDCIVEKQEGDCCPKIWCPETYPPKCPHPSEGEHKEIQGCQVGDKFYPDGVQLPRDPRKPCEVCYCIRNSTSCVMQECELKVEGCTPIYRDGQCCPCRYNCTDKAATTIPPHVLPTEGPQEGCEYNGVWYADGEPVNSTSRPCEHCYCMRNQVVCATEDCKPPHPNCIPQPPEEGMCCPEKYTCDIPTTTALSTSEFTTTSGASVHVTEKIPETSPPSGDQDSTLSASTLPPKSTGRPTEQTTPPTTPHVATSTGVTPETAPVSEGETLPPKVITTKTTERISTAEGATSSLSSETEPTTIVEVSRGVITPAPPTGVAIVRERTSASDTTTLPSTTRREETVALVTEKRDGEKTSTLEEGPTVDRSETSGYVEQGTRTPLGIDTTPSIVEGHPSTPPSEDVRETSLPPTRVPVQEMTPRSTSATPEDVTVEETWTKSSVQATPGETSPISTSESTIPTGTTLGERRPSPVSVEKETSPETTVTIGTTQFTSSAEVKPEKEETLPSQTSLPVTESKDGEKITTRLSTASIATAYGEEISSPESTVTIETTSEEGKSSPVSTVTIATASEEDRSSLVSTVTIATASEEGKSSPASTVTIATASEEEKSSPESTVTIETASEEEKSSLESTVTIETASEEGKSSPISTVTIATAYDEEKISPESTASQDEKIYPESTVTIATTSKEEKSSPESTVTTATTSEEEKSSPESTVTIVTASKDLETSPRSTVSMISTSEDRGTSPDSTLSTLERRKPVTIATVPIKEIESTVTTASSSAKPGKEETTSPLLPVTKTTEGEPLTAAVEEEPFTAEGEKITSQKPESEGGISSTVSITTTSETKDSIATSSVFPPESEETTVAAISQRKETMPPSTVSIATSSKDISPSTVSLETRPERKEATLPSTVTMVTTSERKDTTPGATVSIATFESTGTIPPSTMFIATQSEGISPSTVSIETTAEKKDTTPSSTVTMVTISERKDTTTGSTVSLATSVDKETVPPSTISIATSSEGIFPSTVSIETTPKRKETIPPSTVTMVTERKDATTAATTTVGKETVPPSTVSIATSSEGTYPSTEIIAERKETTPSSTVTMVTASGDVETRPTSKEAASPSTAPVEEGTSSTSTVTIATGKQEVPTTVGGTSVSEVTSLEGEVATGTPSVGDTEGPSREEVSFPSTPTPERTSVEPKTLPGVLDKTSVPPVDEKAETSGTTTKGPKETETPLSTVEGVTVTRPPRVTWTDERPATGITSVEPPSEFTSTVVQVTTLSSTETKPHVEGTREDKTVILQQTVIPPEGTTIEDRREPATRTVPPTTKIAVTERPPVTTTTSTTEARVSKSTITDRPVILPVTIPGERSCRLGHATYKPNEDVPSADPCQVNCKCINSVVYCENISCDVGTENIKGCQMVHVPGECCPAYICGPERPPDIPGLNLTGTTAPAFDGTTESSATEHVTLLVDTSAPSTDGTVTVTTSVPTSKATVPPTGTRHVTVPSTEYTTVEARAPATSTAGTTPPAGTSTTGTTVSADIGTSFETGVQSLSTESGPTSLGTGTTGTLPPSTISKDTHIPEISVTAEDTSVPVSTTAVPETSQPPKSPTSPSEEPTTYQTFPSEGVAEVGSTTKIIEDVSSVGFTGTIETSTGTQTPTEAPATLSSVPSEEITTKKAADVTLPREPTSPTVAPTIKPTTETTTEESLDTVHVTESITPVPEGCLVNGTMYADGQTVDTLDTCEYCYCAEGDLVCARKVCLPPMTTCKPMSTRPGACCPDTHICVMDDGSTAIITGTTAFTPEVTTKPEATVVPSTTAPPSSLPEVTTGGYETSGTPFVIHSREPTETTRTTAPSTGAETQTAISTSASDLAPTEGDKQEKVDITVPPKVELSPTTPPGGDETQPQTPTGQRERTPPTVETEKPYTSTTSLREETTTTAAPSGGTTQPTSQRPTDADRTTTKESGLTSVASPGGSTITLVPTKEESPEASRTTTAAPSGETTQPTSQRPTDADRTTTKESGLTSVTSPGGSTITFVPTKEESPEASRTTSTALPGEPEVTTLAGDDYPIVTTEKPLEPEISAVNVTVTSESTVTFETTGYTDEETSGLVSNDTTAATHVTERIAIVTSEVSTATPSGEPVTTSASTASEVPITGETSRTPPGEEIEPSTVRPEKPEETTLAPSTFTPKREQTSTAPPAGVTTTEEIISKEATIDAETTKARPGDVERTTTVLPSSEKEPEVISPLVPTVFTKKEETAPPEGSTSATPVGETTKTTSEIPPGTAEVVTSSHETTTLIGKQEVTSKIPEVPVKETSPTPTTPPVGDVRVSTETVSAITTAGVETERPSSTPPAGEVGSSPKVVSTLEEKATTGEVGTPSAGESETSPEVESTRAEKVTTGGVETPSSGEFETSPEVVSSTEGKVPPGGVVTGEPLTPTPGPVVVVVGTSQEPVAIGKVSPKTKETTATPSVVTEITSSHPERISTEERTLETGWTTLDVEKPHETSVRGPTTTPTEPSTHQEGTSALVEKTTGMSTVTLAEEDAPAVTVTPPGEQTTKESPASTVTTKPSTTLGETKTPSAPPSAEEISTAKPSTLRPEVTEGPSTFPSEASTAPSGEVSEITERTEPTTDRVSEVTRATPPGEEPKTSTIISRAPPGEPEVTSQESETTKGTPERKPLVEAEETPSSSTVTEPATPAPSGVTQPSQPGTEVTTEKSLAFPSEAISTLGGVETETKEATTAPPSGVTSEIPTSVAKTTGTGWTKFRDVTRLPSTDLQGVEENATTTEGQITTDKITKGLPTFETSSTSAERETTGVSFDEGSTLFPKAPSEPTTKFPANISTASDIDYTPSVATTTLLPRGTGVETLPTTGSQEVATEITPGAAETTKEESETTPRGPVEGAPEETDSIIEGTPSTFVITTPTGGKITVPSTEFTPEGGWIDTFTTKVSTVLPTTVPSTTTDSYVLHEGSCYFNGRVYQSAEQIPRTHSCEFCFCFRGDIICLEQTCPPPIRGCYQTPIHGFCCPRFECPVHVGHLNISTTTTTTRSPISHIKQIQQRPIQLTGCEIDGKFYQVGQTVRRASGPCMQCRCEYSGMMKCDPKDCQPTPPLVLQMNKEFFKSR